MTDIFDDDFDEDAYLEAWDAAAAEAGEILCTALAEERGTPPPAAALAGVAPVLRDGYSRGGQPFEMMAAANGWSAGEVPDDDLELAIWSAGSLMILEEDAGIDTEEMAAIMSLEFADWLGAVVQLVRHDVGAPANPPALVEFINECPEVEGDVDPADEALIEQAFTLVLPAWEASGVVDGGGRLTQLGKWILPRVLAMAWGVDFDT